MYGDEIDKLRNILAFYTLGGIKGHTYSKIDYYMKNAAESISISIDVK
jgi:hypothetical protein